MARIVTVEIAATAERASGPHSLTITKLKSNNTDMVKRFWCSQRVQKHNLKLRKVRLCYLYICNVSWKGLLAVVAHKFGERLAFAQEQVSRVVCHPNANFKSTSGSITDYREYKGVVYLSCFAK